MKKISDVILIPKTTIDKPIAEIPSYYVKHPRQAAACLVVFSSPDKISVHNFVY